MAKLYRSARGVMIDMNLLAIKQQLAAQVPPPKVEARKRAMDAKAGVKSDAVQDLDFLALGIQAAAESADAAESIETVKPAPKARQASQRK